MTNSSTRKLNSLWIIRKHVGLAQKSVAKLLGHRSTSVISEYENGKLLPSLATALRLAAVYDRPITDLYPELYRQIQEEVQIAKGKKHSLIK